MIKVPPSMLSPSPPTHTKTCRRPSRNFERKSSAVSSDLTYQGPAMRFPRGITVVSADCPEFARNEVAHGRWCR
jgi:hypothetical protein